MRNVRAFARRRARVALTGFALLLVPAPGLAQAGGRDRTAVEYRRVLSLLGAGDRDGALQALVALEARVTPGQTPAEVEALWRTKLQVIRDLVSAQVEILVPILLLHHDAFVHYREARQPVLATHSRTMTWELADYYRKKAGSEGARVVAARVLASLGGYLQKAQSLTQSTAAFSAAIDLDARSEAAYLGLAATLEKTGRYPEAVAQLRQLLAVNPRHFEARLRMAINSRRIGADKEGEAMLRDLLESEAPDWIAVLAYEELATYHSERGETPAALDLLRRGVERFPENQRLLLLLAFQQDRALDLRTSLETARRASAAADSGDTPRLRYNEWPAADLDETRRLFVESAAPRLRLLAEALGAGQGLAG